MPEAGPVGAMCGRYVSPKAADIERQWQLTPDAAYRQSFNLAPSQTAPIIRLRDGTRVLDAFGWGFHPPWADRTWINARVETLFTSRAFASAARLRRCLVPAIGWYEWQDRQGRRQPYLCHLENFAPFAFAGIWTTRSAGDVRERSFAIITRPSAAAVQPIHDRMPHIVAPEHYAEWLAPDTADPARLLEAAHGAVSCYAVSSYVNKPAHDDERCIQPLPSRPDSGFPRWNSP